MLQESNKEPTPKLIALEPIPRGSFIFAWGFQNNTSREDIRAALVSYTDDVAFIDFSKGDTEGYIRFNTPFSNKDIIEKVGNKLKVGLFFLRFRIS